MNTKDHLKQALEAIERNEELEAVILDIRDALNDVLHGRAGECPCCGAKIGATRYDHPASSNLRRQPPRYHVVVDFESVTHLGDLVDEVIE